MSGSALVARAVALASVLIFSVVAPVLARTSGGAGPHARIVAYVASVEGVSPAVLRADLASGEPLLRIAGGKYNSADELATALLGPLKTELDTMTKSNPLAATLGLVIYGRLHARVAVFVTKPHPSLKGLAGLTTQLRASVQAIAAFCGTTPRALAAALRAGGRSPLAICQATNGAVTQASLVGAITAQIKVGLDGAVTAHLISTQQESGVLVLLEVGLNRWVAMPLKGQ